jgi:tetratricopeptide (TPR) repeat protein
MFMVFKRKSVRLLVLIVGFFLAITSIILDSRPIPQTANAQDPVELNANGTPVFHIFLPIIFNSAPPSSPPLSPEVETFITGTFLSHATSYPDPNEPVEVLKLYMDGLNLLQQEQIDQALQTFNQAVNRYPESRHAHEGLATTLLQKYKHSQGIEDLRTAVDEFILADRIGLKYGKIHYTYPVAQGLGQLRESKRLDTYFDQAVKEGNEPYLVSLHYAQGLSLLGDPRAEEWYLKAIKYEPEGVADAIAYYAEWLLDRGRSADVVLLVTDDIEVEYTHFLRGVALERLGRTQEAIKEYKRYQRINADFPAPARFKIVGSEAQANSIFEGDIQIAATTSEAKSKLSKLIVCEANSESTGGKRAVGWTVRTRVFRAYSVPTSCGGYPTGVWRALASTASLPDKYIAIILLS